MAGRNTSSFGICTDQNGVYLLLRYGDSIQSSSRCRAVFKRRFSLEAGGSQKLEDGTSRAWLRSAIVVGQRVGRHGSRGCVLVAFARTHWMDSAAARSFVDFARSDQRMVTIFTGRTVDIPPEDAPHCPPLEFSRTDCDSHRMLEAVQSRARDPRALTRSSGRRNDDVPVRRCLSSSAPRSETHEND
jgi:hypothetical protein